MHPVGNMSRRLSDWLAGWWFVGARGTGGTMSNIYKAHPQAKLPKKSR